MARNTVPDSSLVDMERSAHRDTLESLELSENTVGRALTM